MRKRHLYADGALAAKTKVLMALLWSINARCEPCIAYYARHAHAALDYRRQHRFYPPQALDPFRDGSQSFPCDAFDILTIGGRQLDQRRHFL